MERDNLQNETTAGPGEDDMLPTGLDDVTPGPTPAETRIAELAGQLESLRAETDRQLANLRTENAAQLTAYLDLSRTLPGLVPELVGGATLEAVQSSLATAREAYSRIAANLTPQVSPDGGEKSFGPVPGAGGGVRSGIVPGEDQPVKLASERGVNLIYQAIAGGKNGNLAR